MIVDMKVGNARWCHISEWMNTKQNIGIGPCQCLSAIDISVNIAFCYLIPQPIFLNSAPKNSPINLRF
jgi:hypothetical protein